MAIQIVPFLSALSNVAGAAWDLYRRAAQFKEAKHGQKVQDSLTKSVDRLEESHLEQARLISELSRDLEKFAQALQTEVQEMVQRQARLRALVYFALAVAVTGVGISWFLR